MSFQFGLWDLFKQMGEGADEDEVVEDDEQDKLRTRQLVNIAKMIGNLIAGGGLSLAVIKNLNLAYLQPKTKIFLEVMFIKMFLQSQRSAEGGRDEKAVVSVFESVKDNPQLATGVQYFLRKVVSKTDIAGGNGETATVKWACKIAGDFLRASADSDVGQA